MPPTEIQRLRSALKFLTSHIPGASEVAEALESKTLTLETNHAEDPEDTLVGENFRGTETARHQKALNEFKERHLSNLEVGRLYERYIGYLYEKDLWHVTYKGIVDKFDDLGRDLICVKGDIHHIVQAKCWSKKKEIHEKHVYQLHSSTLHYAMSLRKTLRASGMSKAEVGRKMRPINQNLKSIMVSSTVLSENAEEVVSHLGAKMEHRIEKLDKSYPMIKCNINKHTGTRLYHLPFNRTYDTIIIGNVKGEMYVDTCEEAERAGFSYVDS